MSAPLPHPTIPDPEAIEDYPQQLPRPQVQRYTLSVTLSGMEPPVYRHFTVPSNITLRHLSELLHLLMGWEGYHPSHFHFAGAIYVPAYQPVTAEPTPTGTTYSQEEYTLSDLLIHTTDTIHWTYGTTGSWDHNIQLTSIDAYQSGEPLSTFIQGQRSCPPEDCADITQYHQLLALYRKHQAQQPLTPHESTLLREYDMYEGYDPNHFDTHFAHDLCEQFCE